MQFDIIIVGAGLAGASLACALRGSRYRVALLDRAAPSVAPDWDARIYAISPANVSFLERCGAWAHLDAARLQRVQRMQVWGDTGGQIVFDAYECGLDAMAWIAESSRIAHELWETARRQPNVQVFAPAEPQTMHTDAAGAELHLADGRVLCGKLIVAADGVNSWVREQAGIVPNWRPYGEKGLVANYACDKAHQGSAFQWFREDGILAYLPLPGNQISIVWSTPDANAEALLALSPQELAERVAQAGQHQLGALRPLGAAAAFPLRWMRVPKTAACRTVLIGDAAHAIHPLSGHGINLGFQDASALAEVLQALPSFRDCGEADVLARYSRARAEEVALVQGVTDGLNRLFRPRAKPLAWLRNAGMAVSGRLPFVRQQLARYAAGLM